MRMTSPPSAVTREVYSRSGSQITMSSSVERAMSAISSLVEKLLPDPGTPGTKAFGFRSLALSQRMRLRDRAFSPKYTPPGSMISWARNGMRTARLSIVRVRSVSANLKLTTSANASRRMR